MMINTKGELEDDVKETHFRVNAFKGLVPHRISSLEETGHEAFIRGNYKMSIFLQRLFCCINMNISGIT